MIVIVRMDAKEEVREAGKKMNADSNFVWKVKSVDVIYFLLY